VVELNVAFRVALLVITTLQVLDVPEHAPDQALNAEPSSALAVRAAPVPSLTSAPGGLLTAVPLPEPDPVTVRL
jgi:hypothetical protein